MKTYTKAALFFCMTAFSGASLADRSSSLLGTWVGKSNTAVIGDAKHHTKANGSEIRFVSTEFKLVIDKEQGRNFSGYLISNSDKEPIAGAFMSDMINGVFVDSDGSVIFKRTGQDRLEGCYVHTPSATTNSSLASCTDFQRQ